MVRTATRSLGEGSSSLLWLALAGALSLTVACGSEEEEEAGSETDTGAEADTGGGAGGDTGGESDAGTGTDAGGESDAGAPDVEPEGPQPAAPRPYSGGSCPTFEEGTVTFESGGAERKVEVFFPDNPEGASVTFAWHGAGDSASNFSRAIGAAGIATENDTIMIVPWSIDPSIQLSWAILGGDDKEIDAVVFDDVLACLDEQFDIANEYVYTTGFSAGALWSTWLVMNRSEYLAAAVIFSGGVSSFTSEYTTPSTQIPVILTHGGPSDQVLVNFEDAQEEFADSLAADGHLVFICNHNQGHTIPLAGRNTLLPAMFDFGFGVIPDRYLEGVPSSWPAYCELRTAP